MVYNVYLGFFNKHGWTYCRRKKNSTFCKHQFPGNTLTHSTNEDLLNIKRKGDPEVSYPLSYVWYHWNSEPVCNKSHVFFNLLTGTAMNARASENYLAISRSSSASKSVEIFWAEIYWGRLIFRAESRFHINLLILSWINGSNNIELYSINKIMGASLICDYWELEFPYWSPCFAGKDYLPSLTLLCGINYSTCKQIGIPLLTFDNVLQI
jgi:hypothetical protein